VTFSRLAMTTAAVILLAASLVAAPAEITLKPGDKAPALSQVDWLKGEPVSTFQSGQVYVLDFWATWCGPCVRSIPHVNELASSRKKDGVTVIGVAIWPSDSMVPTKTFVDDQGDKMNYTIATDIEGATAEAYMTASGSRGIPTAMVIDREGVVAWIGHPMDGMDGVVDAVVDGSFDMAAEAEKRAEQQKSQAVVQTLSEAIGEALQANDWEAAYENATKLAELDERYGSVNSVRYQALLYLDESGERAAELGRELLTKTFKEDPRQLNGLAWFIVAPDNGMPEGMADLELAMLAIQRANELTAAADPNVLDTMACVQFAQGDHQGALKTQEAAIAILEADEGGSESSREAMLKKFRETLAKYRDAQNS